MTASFLSIRRDGHTGRSHLLYARARPKVFRGRLDQITITETRVRSRRPCPVPCRWSDLNGPRRRPPHPPTAPTPLRAAPWSGCTTDRTPAVTGRSLTGPPLSAAAPLTWAAWASSGETPQHSRHSGSGSPATASHSGHSVGPEPSVDRHSPRRQPVVTVSLPGAPLIARAAPTREWKPVATVASPRRRR